MFSTIGKRIAVSSIDTKDAILKAMVTLIYDYHILDPSLNEERTDIEQYITTEGEVHRLFIKLGNTNLNGNHKSNREIVMLKSTFDDDWNAWKCAFYRKVNAYAPKEDDKWARLDAYDKRRLSDSLIEIHRNKH